MNVEVKQFSNLMYKSSLIKRKDYACLELLGTEVCFILRNPPVAHISECCLGISTRLGWLNVSC